MADATHRNRSDPNADHTLPRGSGGGSAQGFSGLGASIGRYTVVGQLGSGAMGTVLAAHDSMLNRRVALKLLYASQEDAEAKTRLVREAQALAAISHPNVVTVYEVNQVEGQWFLAMELVDGGTLATWQASRSRSWRQIVDAYIQAARGLSAAHRAGLVHRDFKPSNALIRSDGVVRVSDFGLVRALVGEAPVPAPTELDVPLEPRITRTGAIVGTPSYMAPEQHQGDALDARTDQFAFGCALYEALYGQRPFDGDTYSQRAANCVAGSLRPEPASNRVPSRIRAAVRRALSVRREDRFPDMDALVAALSQPRLSMRARVFLGTGLVAAAVSAVAFLSGEAACTDLDAPLRQTWNAEISEKLRTAFEKTGLPFAATSAQSVTSLLNSYRDEWTTSRVAACRAAKRGEISTARFDDRMHCLDRSLRALDNLVTRLTTAPADVVGESVHAAERLPAVRDCADERLAISAPLPTNPEARAQIAAEEQRLAQAETLESLSQFDEAMNLAKGVAAAADRLGYLHLSARAHQLVGRNIYRREAPEVALRALDQAAQAAASAKDDVLLADILSTRFYVMGDRQGKYGEALGARRYVELLLERAGQPPLPRALWLTNLGIVLMESGALAEARQAHEEALAIREKLLGQEHSLIVQSLDGLGNTLTKLGEHEAAEKLLRRALEIDERRLGATHPSVASELNNLGGTLAMREKIDDAIAAWDRAYQIERLGGGHDSWMSLANAGISLQTAGRIRESHEKLTAALAEAERSKAHPPHLALVCFTLGLSSELVGKAEAAQQLYDRAVALSEQSGVVMDTEIMSMARLALLASSRGSASTARTLLQRAERTLEKAEPGQRATAEPTVRAAAAELARKASGCAAALPHDLAVRASVLERHEPPGAVEMESWRRAGECLFQQGKVAEARKELTSLVERLNRNHADEQFSAPARAALARANAGDL